MCLPNISKRATGRQENERFYGGALFVRVLLFRRERHVSVKKKVSGLSRGSDEVQGCRPGPGR